MFTYFSVSCLIIDSSQLGASSHVQIHNLLYRVHTHILIYNVQTHHILLEFVPVSGSIRCVSRSGCIVRPLIRLTADRKIIQIQSIKHQTKHTKRYCLSSPWAEDVLAYTRYYRFHKPHYNACAMTWLLDKFYREWQSWNNMEQDLSVDMQEVQGISSCSPNSSLRCSHPLRIPNTSQLTDLRHCRTSHCIRQCRTTHHSWRFECVMQSAHDTILRISLSRTLVFEFAETPPTVSPAPI